MTRPAIEVKDCSGEQIPCENCADYAVRWIGFGVLDRVSLCRHCGITLGRKLLVGLDDRWSNDGRWLQG